MIVMIIIIVLLPWHVDHLAVALLLLLLVGGRLVLQ
jgi:hypothetical protein